jgi:hypothetical protein
MNRIPALVITPLLYLLVIIAVPIIVLIIVFEFIMLKVKK